MIFISVNDLYWRTQHVFKIVFTGNQEISDRSADHGFTALSSGRIIILAGPLHGLVDEDGAESMTDIIRNWTEEGIRHVKEYQGLELRTVGIRVVPSLNSLCS